MADWQPIETAPRDGDHRVMLWCTDMRVTYLDRTPQPLGAIMGRVWDGVPSGDGLSGDWNFTHWMPLPGPPVIEQLTGKPATVTV